MGLGFREGYIARLSVGVWRLGLGFEVQAQGLTA